MAVISVIIDLLFKWQLEQLGVREQVLEEPDALGIVIAVGNALVDRKAEVDRLAHGDEAVLIVKRRPLLFADDAEERAGAPVRKMVVAAAQADGAEVGEEHRGVVRIVPSRDGRASG